MLGFDAQHSHPKNMIIRTLLVPPPIIRPAIMIFEASKARGQDELTHKLQDILKHNIQLKEHIDRETAAVLEGRPGMGNFAVTRTSLLNDLQVDVANYMSIDKSSSNSQLSRSTKPMRSLSQRLKGKLGRIRYNLMGKRVDFSGRSVISPDPILDLDQVGIPEYIALQLTIPERVTRYNIDKMIHCVHTGPGKVGGAEAIIQPDGTQIKLKFCKHRDRILLEFGWIVERYLRDGDWVVINRQPTLHKSSMMSHRVRLMPGLSIRLNLSVVGPYNADFDGNPNPLKSTTFTRN